LSRIDFMNVMTVSGMTCAGCARKVEAAVKALSPEATVTLEPPRVSMPASIPVAKVNEALTAIGKYRVVEPSAQVAAAGQVAAWFGTYRPLLLIMGLIALASFAGQSWMMAFMAGFYIVFGAFKLLDVPAFANAYAQYDIIAKVFKPWGYVYPFVELALGFAFLFWFQMGAATWAALILSVIGAIGVIQSVLGKQTIQCACLGTVFQLPMSTVTIIENAGMAAMAAWMLIAGM
jgi:copper chaperone CopZ